jgi:hypothetical protein
MKISRAKIHNLSSLFSVLIVGIIIVLLNAYLQPRTEILLLIAALGAWYSWQVRPRRKRQPGFKFIYVYDDGSARELRIDEQKYLNTKFKPTDSGRPYIKHRYESRTQDGRMSGYLPRHQLPKKIQIKPALFNKPSHFDH